MISERNKSWISGVGYDTVKDDFTEDLIFNYNESWIIGLWLLVVFILYVLVVII
jgi:hypothetical protein